jgi:hypothetical protein
MNRSIILHDPHLLCQSCYLDGTWAMADTNATMPIISTAVAPFGGMKD